MVEYYFEELQTIKFEVYDVDSAGASLAKQDFIGYAQCNLSDVLTLAGQKINLNLMNGAASGNRGTIMIEAEEMANVNSLFKIALSGYKLDKKDFFGKSDPYINISRAREGGTFTRVHQTEVIKNTLDPRWMAVTVPIQRLCNGDLKRPLLFECFDWNKTMEHELIGSFQTSVDEILSGKRDFELINKAKLNKNPRKYKNSGTIRIDAADLIKQHTFLEYIAGGCEISLIVAIDFTASNGNPMHSTSLHYNNPYQPNEYVAAIKTVGEILSAYDSDHLFPAFGFGAKLPPTMEVSHCFALNANPAQPEVQEVQGILQAYAQALNSVVLYGPTIFSQILRVAHQYASQVNTEAEQKYFILLIITDGVINDMQDTCDWIVKMCKLPISVVIVGVGSADFTNMEVLDADDNPLRSSTGERASRDIVQFVPFRKFKDDPVRLAKETLAEVPHQLVSYMAANRVPPGTTGRGIRAKYEEPLPRSSTMIISTTSTSTVTGPAPVAQPLQQPQLVSQPSQVMQPQQPLAPQQYPQQMPPQQQPQYPPQQNYPQQYPGQPGLVRNQSYQIPPPQQTQQPGLVRNQSYQVPPPQQGYPYPTNQSYAPPQQQQTPQQLDPRQSWYGQPPAQPQSQPSWYGQPPPSY